MKVIAKNFAPFKKPSLQKSIIPIYLVSKINNFNKFRKPAQRRKRSLSRLMAIQIFYQYGFFNGEKTLSEIQKDVIENYTLDDEKNIDSYRDKIDEVFLDSLLAAAIGDVKIIDSDISEFLKDGKDFEKTDEVVKEILRLGAFELKFMNDIPAKVIIDEYVDIAASFFDNRRVTFVNATLDNLAKKFRTEEFKK
jgi:N utilization substance protein B